MLTIPPPPSRARALNALSMWAALPQGAETTVTPSVGAAAGDGGVRTSCKDCLGPICGERSLSRFIDFKSRDGPDLVKIGPNSGSHCTSQTMELVDKIENDTDAFVIDAQIVLQVPNQSGACDVRRTSCGGGAWVSSGKMITRKKKSKIAPPTQECALGHSEPVYPSCKLCGETKLAISPRRITKNVNKSITN
jgi:hypothetical protein